MGVALVEKLSFDQANIQVESVEDGGQKNLFMRGVFIQGDVKNQNQRVYPINEINKAVKSLKEKINSEKDSFKMTNTHGEVKLIIDQISKETLNKNLSFAGRGTLQQIALKVKSEKDLLDSLNYLPDQPYVLNYLAYAWVEKNININQRNTTGNQGIEIR